MFEEAGWFLGGCGSSVRSAALLSLENRGIVGGAGAGQGFRPRRIFLAVHLRSKTVGTPTCRTCERHRPVEVEEVAEGEVEEEEVDGGGGKGGAGDPASSHAPNRESFLCYESPPS